MEQVSLSSSTEVKVRIVEFTKQHSILGKQIS